MNLIDGPPSPERGAGEQPWSRNASILGALLVVGVGTISYLTTFAGVFACMGEDPIPETSQRAGFCAPTGWSGYWFLAGYFLPALCMLAFVLAAERRRQRRFLGLGSALAGALIVVLAVVPPSTSLRCDATEAAKRPGFCAEFE